MRSFVAILEKLGLKFNTFFTTNLLLIYLYILFFHNFLFQMQFHI
jgi:hypothetical protein